MDIVAGITETTVTGPTEARFLRGFVRVAWARLGEARSVVVATTDTELWLDRAAEILVYNIGSGRFTTAQSFLPAQPEGQQTLMSYAGQILTELLAEWERIELLRQGDSAQWAANIARLERLAFRWFGPFGREKWAAWEAREVAAKTCADLWAWLQSNPYPFDVSFDRWSARALNNRLREHARKQRTYRRHVVESLDRAAFTDGTTYGELVSVDTLGAWLEQTTNREALLQALAQLDERQARVIRLWYLESWPADEIAADLGRQVGYVYVLRFRAIKKLRKIILEDVRLGLTGVLGILEAEEVRSAPMVGWTWDEETLT